VDSRAVREIDVLRKGLIGGGEQRPDRPHGRWFITPV
jgi:hypothetical protein